VKGCFEILKCQHENRGRGKKKENENKKVIGAKPETYW
jgi:hypothetical protein